jgi:vacuolar-type H+-ATPase subunit E/Vma4
MGLAEIEEKILAEAEEAAARIIAQAETEAKHLAGAANVRAEADRENILAQAHRDAEAARQAILVPARLAAKRKLLEEKHRLLDQVFAGVAPAVREEKELEVAKFIYG